MTNRPKVCDTIARLRKAWRVQVRDNACVCFAQRSGYTRLTRDLTVSKMSRLRPLCGVAALLALLATVSAQNAVSQTCTGGARRQECGATWAPNNAFVPTNRCATCPADFGCTCPKAECMSIVSACLAAPGLVSYQVTIAAHLGAVPLTSRSRSLCMRTG